MVKGPICGDTTPTTLVKCPSSGSTPSTNTNNRKVLEGMGVCEFCENHVPVTKSGKLALHKYRTWLV